MLDVTATIIGIAVFYLAAAGTLAWLIGRSTHDAVLRRLNGGK